MINNSKNNKLGPLIPVKKKDGTVEHMTMAEFKEYKKNLEGEAADLGVKEKKDESTSFSTPIDDVFVAEIPAKPKVQEAKPVDKKVVQEVAINNPEPVKKNIGKFSDIINKLGFVIPSEDQKNLEMLIESRLKNVRTDEQLLEHATRAKNEGGLGLSPVQAKELLTAVTGSPQNIMPERQPASTQVAPRKVAGLENKNAMDNRMDNTTKTVLHDVKPMQREGVPVGPVEEMGMLSLVDFKRLASDASKSKDVILDKFDVLKKESFLLYMDATQAWLKSPLYREYQSVIKKALDSGQAFEEILSDAKGDMMALDEFLAIVELNSHVTHNT